MPILYVTAYPELAEAELGHEDDTFLRKPVDLGQLLETVTNTIAQSRQSRARMRDATAALVPLRETHARLRAELARNLSASARLGSGPRPATRRKDGG
jgi:hypothetical protein